MTNTTEGQAARYFSIRYMVPLICYIFFAVYNVIWNRSAFAFLWDFNVYYDKTLLAQAGQSAYFPYYSINTFLYHPSVLTFMSLFTLMSKQVASIVWLGSSLIAYIAAVILLFRLYKITESGKQRIIWVLFLGFGPLWEMLQLGQINAFMLLALTLVLYWGEMDRPIAAGIMLGVAILLKTSPIILLPMFLVQRQFRLILSMVATILIASAITAVQFGIYPFVEYARVLSLIASDLRARVQLNLSSTAVSLRLLDMLGLSTLGDAVSLANKIVYICLIVFLLLYTLRNSKMPAKRSRWLLGIFLVLMVAVSPVVWFHHMVFFVIPLFLVLADNLPLGILIMLILQSERTIYNVLSVYVGIPAHNMEVMMALTAGVPTVIATVILLVIMAKRYCRPNSIMINPVTSEI